MSPAPAPLLLIHMRNVQGYWMGLRQPHLRLQLQILSQPAGPTEAPSGLERMLDAELIPMPAGLELQFGAAPAMAGLQPRVWPTLQALNQLLVRLQESAGLPVTKGLICAAITPVPAHAEDPVPRCEVTIAVPSHSPGTLGAVLPWALQQLAAVLYAGQDHLQGLADAVKAMERLAPDGVNTRMLLKAAFDDGIPVMTLSGRVFQYGWGARSRWMDSTFTDAASAISARLARSKSAANSLLRRYALPVPDQVVVRTPGEAVAAAARMGWPVVIKPNDLDGGKGVSAGIGDENTLRLCYERAAALSKNLILEKHIEGNDYRLGIIHGQLGWATHRAPAGVWGDGRSSIEQLVAIANQDPRRGTQNWSNMRPLTIDVEVQELLQAQGLTPASTPVQGQFVRFRRTCNISSGGTPTDMMGRVHADNIALAQRAAAALRLDIAGIDLITPDATRSWREVGGAICEINSQPQFSVLRPQAAQLALRGLCQGDGRVGTLLIITPGPVQPLLQALATSLQARGLTLGFSTGTGLAVGPALIRSGRVSAFEDARALMLDRQAQVIAVATDGEELARTGCPFDAVDLLLVDRDASPVARRFAASIQRAQAWPLDFQAVAEPAALAAQLAERLAHWNEHHGQALPPLPPA